MVDFFEGFHVGKNIRPRPMDGSTGMNLAKLQ